VLNHVFRMEKEFMLLGGSSENHSKAFLVREKEKTLHSIESLINCMEHHI